MLPAYYTINILQHCHFYATTSYSLKIYLSYCTRTSRELYDNCSRTKKCAMHTTHTSLWFFRLSPFCCKYKQHSPFQVCSAA